MVTFRIPSKLYFDLYQRGGDKLVAMYAILKTSRNKEIKYYSYKSKNNKVVAGYSLLRNKTNISLATLNKYVPILIDMELCFFDFNGDFVLIGNEKINKRFKLKKLVPIQIGRNLIDTALNVLQIRLHSSEKKQIKKIEIKTNQSVLLSRIESPNSLKEYKKALRIEKNKKRDEYVIDKSVLSIRGYARIKDGSNSKGKGNYWKNRMIKKGKIKTKRRFLIIKEMSFQEFNILKNSKSLNREFIYSNGFLVKELVSELNVISQCKK